MNRIWITGNSASGKTTLANFIGEKFNIPVYHRDSITWDENDIAVPFKTKPQTALSRTPEAACV